jgi:hypothetical protein
VRPRFPLRGQLHDCTLSGRLARCHLFAVAPINVIEAYQNVAQVVEELKAEGMHAHYYRYSFEVNGHPNGVQSARMAQELYNFITTQRLLR